MCRRSICLVSFVLVLGLVGSASAGVIYSDSFDRADSPTLGTNDNALGGVISAPWVEVQADETQHQIRGNTLVMAGSSGNSYIGHKFTGAELMTTFTIEFDVMPSALITGRWFAIDFGPGPESFTTSIDVNQNRVTLGLLLRPQSNFVVWDNGANINTNNSEVIDNSSNPVPVRLQIDSPDGYSDGNTATIQFWINDVLVENFAGGSSYDFTWEGHTDGVYISFECHNPAPERIVDNLVISSPFSTTEAFDPIPADEATDVRRDVVLNWSPGHSAGAHDVYFGTVLDDVNDAGRANPLDVLVSQGQSASTYVPVGLLDIGQTYYWRIDEVNAPPDSTIFKGGLWQFTAEPIAYPIPGTSIAATGSDSFNASTGPENTVNGSGLDSDDLHSTDQTDMWLTGMMGPQPSWIEYEFGQVYKLHEMWVWNSNQTIEPLVGFGLKDVTIEHSADGINWTTLAGAPEFARAPGVAGYAHNTTVDFGGAAARYVRITANDNWGFLNQYGLSEVRFFYIPVWAREPDPASGATDLALDATLGFRAGRKAAKHDVYISTDEQAVIDGTAPVTTVTEVSHGPLSLDLGQTYYWRVDEVNEAEIPTAWQGDIWDFATQEYFVLEDFEAYDDYEPNRIFDTWIDGWGVPTNGSTMGYPDPIFVLGEHFAETTIRHGGFQSAPLFYDNTAGATFSEATRTVDTPRDWTQAGVKALTLWFYGDPNNPATEQMYVKVNGSKVLYDGDPESLARVGWQMWYIDLTALGVNLTNVTELTIGLERSGVVGGKGVVYFDTIRLSAYDRQLVTPAEPNTASLLAHWTLDEGSGTTVTDASGNGRDGTFNGDPQWVAGKFGGALRFDGVDDYVIHTLPEARNYDSFTVALWVRAATLGQAQYKSPFSSHTPNSSGIQIDVDGTYPGLYRTNPGLEYHFGPVTLDWVHLALVGEGTAVHYYYNGTWATSGTLTENDLLFNEFSIGVSRNDANYFGGTIDEFRVYDIALTPDEIAWLGGRTTPFDKPFRSP